MPYKNIDNEYIFLSFLGKGGFGQVWKVKNKKTGEIRAVKLIEKKDQEKQIKSIENETSILKFLNKQKDSDRYIIKTYRYFIGMGSDPSNKKIIKPFYVFEMDFFDGYTLSKILKIKKFTIDEICKVIKHLLYGLQFIHSHGVVHRDIKPQNIMFNEKRLVYVDFGLACLIENCIGRSGTPGYFAPEIKNIIDINIDWKKADIYSLGKTIEYVVSRSQISTVALNKIIKKMTEYFYHLRPSIDNILLKIQNSCDSSQVIQVSTSTGTGKKTPPTEEL